MFDFVYACDPKEERGVLLQITVYKNQRSVSTEKSITPLFRKSFSYRRTLYKKRGDGGEFPEGACYIPCQYQTDVIAVAKCFL